MVDETKHAGVEGGANARAHARLRIAAALTALVGAIVAFTLDIALAATASAQPPKSMWSALPTVAGLFIFILGLSRRRCRHLSGGPTDLGCHWRSRVGCPPVFSIFPVAKSRDRGFLRQA